MDLPSVGFRKCIFGKPKALWRIKGMQKFSFGEAFVYFLVKRETVIYVGSTNSLSRRIRTHRKKIDFDEAYFLPFEEEKDARAKETFYIKKIRPQLNKIANPNISRAPIVVQEQHE